MVEDDDSVVASNLREPLRIGAFRSGVTERLLRPLSSAWKIRARLLEDVSLCAVIDWISSSASSLGGSGVIGGQLESELSSEDLTVGVLAREFVVFVFVERELEERWGLWSGSVCCGCGGCTSSSITSTT